MCGRIRARCPFEALLLQRPGHLLLEWDAVGAITTILLASRDNRRTDVWSELAAERWGLAYEWRVLPRSKHPLLVARLHVRSLSCMLRRLNQCPPVAPWLALALSACAAPRPLSTPMSTPAPLHADSVREQTLAPGVRHRYLWNAAGPWAVHVVEVELRACGIALQTAKAEERVVGRATTSAMAARVEARLGRPVLAAVNGDFFRFDPPGVPVGAQVVAGEMVTGPAARPVFGLTDEGVPFVAQVRLEGEVRNPAGFAAPLAEVNAPPAGETLAIYNRFIGETTPADTGVVELPVRRLTMPRAVGDTLRGVVLAVDTLPAGVRLPEEGVVFAGRGRGAMFLRDFLAVGDTLRWTLRLDPARGRVRELVGGFPRLIEAGTPVHGLDPEVSPSFGETRHPRTAVGWRADGTLLLVTVDGRQPGYSEGMSLAELGDLFLRLGAVEALNLDGGGSTAMVLRGVVVNRPSDRNGERANANALLILGPPPGACTPN